MALPVLATASLIALFLDDYSARIQVTSFVPALQMGLVVRVLQQSQEAQKKRGAMLFGGAGSAGIAVAGARAVVLYSIPRRPMACCAAMLAQNLTSLVVYVVLVPGIAGIHPVDEGAFGRNQPASGAGEIRISGHHEP